MEIDGQSIRRDHEQDSTHKYQNDDPDTRRGSRGSHGPEQEDERLDKSEEMKEEPAAKVKNEEKKEAEKRTSTSTCSS